MKNQPKPLLLALPTGFPHRPGGVTIQQLPTGVRGLDQILGGGIPEFSVTIIGGMPGCGKTTLAHQIAFANASLEKPSLYLTVAGEPVLNMLRYQQQYAFFDRAKLDREMRFVNLSEVVLERDLSAVLEEIIKQVKAIKPGVVVIDSFRTVMRTATGPTGEARMQSFLHQLAQFMTTWETTAFLVGEYGAEEIRDNPLFTISDGILWLSQVADRNSVVRKLQVMKLRGQGSLPGMHTIRITDSGLQTFPRSLGLTEGKVRPARREQLSMGIPELDKMMGGGLRQGDSLLITGPSGTGKSALATQFIGEGLLQGEPGVIAIFEERPHGYLERAETLGLGLKAAQGKGKLEVLYLRPLDLSVDETMQEILDAIARVGAKRLVIDSLVGFEMALAPSFRLDFRESLYRMIVALTDAGVTILSTVEVEDSFGGLPFSQYAISFLTDDIIRLRYAEIDGQLRKIIMVVKMRGGNHSKDIREYIITHEGVVVMPPGRTDYHGLTTGIPTRTGPRIAQQNEGAPEPKAAK